MAEIKELPLVGKLLSELSDKELPLNWQCLSYFFYLMRTQKLERRQSVNIVAKRCIEIYNKAGIPTIDTSNVVRHIMNMYAERNNIQKSVNSSLYKQKSVKFQKKLNIVFDIEKKPQKGIIREPEEPEITLKISEAAKSKTALNDPLA